MSIQLVCAGIQTIGAAVSGITMAFDVPPANLETAELPALFVFTGRASDDEEILGSDEVMETRTYRVQVAVLPTGQGDPNTRERLCRPLIEAVVQAFESHPSLGGVAGVQNAYPSGDSGVAILPEWGGKFIGFEVQLSVTTVRDRVLASGE
jgi:hypothetical protein